MQNGNQNDAPVGKATAAAESASAIQWDVEEDHLLSYFLGGENDTVGELMSPDNNGATAEHLDDSNNMANIEPAIFRPSSEPIKTSIPENSSSIVGSPLNDADDATKRRSSLREGGRAMSGPPSVQPMHFNHGEQFSSSQSLHGTAQTVDTMPTQSNYNSFVNASQQQRNSSSSLQNRSGSSNSMHKVPSRTDTASSSSSSLSSMAAALALGGPNQVLYMQQKLQSRDLPSPGTQYNQASPLTPLNMMGSPQGQEMMMLPPPPRFPVNGQASMPQQHIQQQHSVRHPQQHPTSAPPPWYQSTATNAQHSQQHIQWIQQMNKAAMGATQQTFQPQQQQQQPNQQVPQMNFPHPSPTSSGVTPQSHAQIQLPMQQYQQQQQQQQQQQSHQQPQKIQPQIQSHPQHQMHQFHVGTNGATIPVTAVPGADGNIVYQIHPNVAQPSRYFVKAISDITKPEEPEKVDPAVLAEKRQRRLARNRESARQSRRRKKEHLANLGAKVDRLQRHLETEIRSKIRSMETGLIKNRWAAIDKWIEQEKVGFKLENGGNNLAIVLRSNGPNCPLRRAVMEHQFNLLRQAFLSNHNQFSLWLMMQSEAFFSKASALRQQKEGPPAKGSKALTRANSKQIGEDIFNKEKKSEKGVTSNAQDDLRMWPLFCHEITMTMDQEDRINGARENAQVTHNLRQKMNHIKMATSATNSLRNASLCLSHFSSHHNESLLVDILTPSQTAAFMEWFRNNKGRCQTLLQRKYPKKPIPVDGDVGIERICDQLDEIMTLERNQSSSRS